MAKYVTSYAMKGLKRPMFSPDQILVLPRTLRELPDRNRRLPGRDNPPARLTDLCRVSLVPRLTIGSLNMGFRCRYLTVQQTKAGNRFSARCLIEGICLVWWLSCQKFLCAFFPKSSSHRARMIPKRKMNSTGVLVRGGFVDQEPNAANHPDYPFSASSLGGRLIEKGLSLSLPAIAPKIDVGPPNCSGENCIYGRKHVPWIRFAGVPKGTMG